MAALPSHVPVASQRQMADHLKSLKWKEDLDFRAWMHGAQCFTSPRGAEFSVLLEGESWELGEFTDSDVGGVAVGRYKTVEDGEGLEALDEAIQGRTGYLIYDAIDPDELAELRAEAEADEWNDMHAELRCPGRE